MVATCDGTIQVNEYDSTITHLNLSNAEQVLDPFRGQMVYRYAQAKEGLPFAAMAAVPAPSTNILAATSDGIVRYEYLELT